MFGQAGGLLIGYLLAISGLPLLNLIFTIAIVLFVPVVIIFFGDRVHSSHIENWDHIRERGPFRFVFVRYILYLGVPSSLAVLFGVAPMIPSTDLQFRLLLFIDSVLLIGMAAIGYYEWLQCEQEFSVSLMERTASKFHVPVEGEPTPSGTPAE